MAKNLMIQGTMSGAGKSILTAGILRVLYRDGYRVAPFKSQNMALNSYVTDDGREMGRAQVLQAYAAGTAPTSDMNPILLKPMGDTTSQIIVEGIPVGNMRAMEYYDKKTGFIQNIMAAYERLSAVNDIIVIEGAGSPVEINLRENDIVNMGLAKMLDAPVLLAGNIDPGGVFAQLLGTVALMPPDEKERVKGLIINKFRGDIKLLEPGLKMFGEYLDIPFAGVVPYVDLTLDEEDSMSDVLKKKTWSGDTADRIRIAVIRLPYISNYTDYGVFGAIPETELIYTDDPDDIDKADIVIIPGTKNTTKDLKWLFEKNIDRAVIGGAKNGKLVIGICGGFQMLGRIVDDKAGTEGGGTVKGLSLLHVDTVFCDKKTLRRYRGRIDDLSGTYEALTGTDVEGYEIHMGESTHDEHDVYPVVTEGNVLGTYLHGIFDNAELTEKLLGIAADKKGIKKEIKVRDVANAREEELDRLADVLRETLDWKLIYDAIGI